MQTKTKIGGPARNATQKVAGGYTIIETMISISLFSVVVISGMSALLTANLLHQKSQDMRSIIDSLSFIAEDISRNARTGYNYHCFEAGEEIPASTSSLVSTPKSCPDGWAIAFESDTGDPDDHNDQWVYYIGVDDSIPTEPISIWKSTDGPYTVSSFTKLNPDEVVLDGTSGFSILGAEAPIDGNTQQPFITIRLSGTITFKDVVTPFSLQTSVSQRYIDI